MTQEEIKIEKVEVAIPEETEQEKRRGIFSEKVLLFILAVLIGMAVKTEAVKRVTIGFDDYLMKFESQSYNLNKMQDQQIQKMMEEAKQSAQPGEENQASEMEK